MPDKVLLANIAALKKKYGPSGHRKIKRAVEALIDADRQRDLRTLLVDISSEAQMKRFRGRAVTNPRSERQNKEAVDRVYLATQAHYLVLLDGPVRTWTTQTPCLHRPWRGACLPSGGIIRK